MQKLGARIFHWAQKTSNGGSQKDPSWLRTRHITCRRDQIQQQSIAGRAPGTCTPRTKCFSFAAKLDIRLRFCVPKRQGQRQKEARKKEGRPGGFLKRAGPAALPAKTDGAKCLGTTPWTNVPCHTDSESSTHNKHLTKFIVPSM